MGRLTKVGGFGPLLFTLLLLTPAHATTNPKHIRQWFPAAKTQASGANIYFMTDEAGAPHAIPYNGCDIEVDDVFVTVNSASSVANVSVSLVQQDQRLAGTLTPNYADGTIIPTSQTIGTNWRGWWHGSWTFSKSDLTLDNADNNTPVVWPESSPPDRLGIFANVQLTQNVSASGFIRVIYKYVNCQ